MMATAYADDFARVLAALRERGLLLLTDQRLPSVATLVAGEPVRGSWWGHARGGAIFAVAQRLEALAAELVCIRLVSGKETYVHRRLWPALVGVGTARAAWQLDTLTPLAWRLLAVVDRDGTARTDDLDELGPYSRRTLGEAARELERALLVVGESVHTDSGAHAKHLRTWAYWAVVAAFDRAEQLPPGDGARLLESTLAALNAECDARGRLPWPTL